MKNSIIVSVLLLVMHPAVVQGAMADLVTADCFIANDCVVVSKVQGQSKIVSGSVRSAVSGYHISDAGIAFEYAASDKSCRVVSLKSVEGKVDYPQSVMPDGDDNPILEPYSGDVVIPSAVEINGVEYSVTGWSADAFAGCPGLSSLTIPFSVADVREIVDCPKLTKIIALGNVSSIEGLDNLPSLESLPLTPPDDGRTGTKRIAGIRSMPFVEFVVPDYVEHVEMDDMPVLTYFEHGIGERYVRGLNSCPMLAEVVIPDNVEAIDRDAFGYLNRCPNLKHVTIGKGCKQIGVFCNDNPSMRLIVCKSENPPFMQMLACGEGRAQFAGVPLEACTLVVPDGCRKAYADAYIWREFGRIVEQSEYETGIGEVSGAGLDVSAADGVLRIVSAEPADVRVYDVSGVCVVSEQVCGERGFGLPGGVYVVTADGRSVKVAL